MVQPKVQCGFYLPQKEYMEEVTNNSSDKEEVALPDTTNHGSPEPVSIQNVTSKVTEDDPADRDFKAIRRRKKELEDTIRRQNELIDRLTAQSTPTPTVVDELSGISSDQYIDKGKTEKLVEKMASQIAEQRVKEILNQQEQSRFAERLKQKYPDFTEIVTPDSLALLEEQEPELALAIADTKDPYKIGVQSYKYIKALGLSDKIPSSAAVKEVEKRIERNENSAPSPQSFDKRPMAQAFNLTKEEKSKLFNEMMQYASQAGFSY